MNEAMNQIAYNFTVDAGHYILSQLGIICQKDGLMEICKLLYNFLLG